MRSLTLDEMIDRYEAALADRDWRMVSLTDFTPLRSTPEYWPTLVELLRIRMEHAADRDPPASQLQPEIIDWDVNACLSQFPELQRYPEFLSDLAYEEYRLKRAAGYRVSPLEYRDRLDIDVGSWNTTLPKELSTQPRALSKAPLERLGSSENRPRESSPSPAALSSLSSSTSAARHSQRLSQPELESGEVLGSFRILCSLGSGALARVYLAQQLDLSERAVVLKVASQATLEPQKIAQLQHPHIVQIFSVHEFSGYQILCMPYAGATTLADFLVSRQVSNGQVNDDEVNDSHVHQGQVKNSQRDNSTTSANRAQQVNSQRLTSQQLVTTLSNRQRAVQTLVEDKQSTTAREHKPIQLNHGLQWPERWNTMSFELVMCELLLQVARGLAHAHRFGIVHSDLKPANILVGDDGQARLVDFNVSQEMASANRHLLGGTLPYMAPEHLQSLLEDRWLAGPPSDLYSLGVIAFQLLSSRLPYESTTGSLQQVLEHAIEQRRTYRLDYRLTAHEASTDMRSIIGRLMQPDPTQRYRSADDLCEDLQRHLNHQSLKHAPNHSLGQRFHKWTRRHPRLSSATSVAIAATLCMMAIVAITLAYRNQWRREQAVQLLGAFRAQLPTALVHAVSYRHYQGLVQAAADSSERLLSVLRAPGSEAPAPAIQFLNDSEQDEIAAALSSLDQSLQSSAMASALASSHTSPNPKLPSQIVSISQAMRSLMEKLHSYPSAATRSRSAVSVDFTDLQSAVQAFTDGNDDRSIELLSALTARSPQHYAAWLLLGTLYNETHQSELAESALGRAVSLIPDQWQGWFYRGQIALGSAHTSGRRDQYQAAVAYFTRALQLKPNLADALLNRALCYEQLGNTSAALKDAEQLIELKQLTLRAHLIASRLNRRLGNTQLAAEQLQLALASPPESAQDYVYRGTLRLSQDRVAAADDFRRANQLDPEDPEVCQSLAVLLMEVEPDREEAAQVLDRWVTVTGGSALALASRGVQRARAGQTELALSDAEQALKSAPKPRERAQIASIFVMLAAQAGPDEARRLQSRGLSLLTEALQLEWRLVSEIKNDPDMNSLRDDSRFQLLIQVVTRFGQLPSLIQTSSTSPGQP